jgi:hypothetical protein
MLFCPGLGPIGNREYFPFAEPPGAETFSDKNPILSLTKLEMTVLGDSLPRRNRI